MLTIAVIGTGYVGLITGVCFAELGHKVTCLDVDEMKIERLKGGQAPIFEPQLPALLQKNLRAGRLSFTTSYQHALRDAEFAFVAVNTPAHLTGQAADLSYVMTAARSIAEAVTHDIIVVTKSTVPVGTGELMQRLLRKHGSRAVQFSVVSNPEFLREGSAIPDCLNPDRVVIGSSDRWAAEAVAKIYVPFHCPILITDLRTSEMIKYASNAMLATRISFSNEIAEICEQVGADAKQVALGMGYDRRIGPAFLNAGLGYGGSCFPKDVNALMHMALTAGCYPRLLRAVTSVNDRQRRRLVAKLRSLLGPLSGRTVGLLGLAFKPDTDDVREAPALEIARLLKAEGVQVRAYDPVAMRAAHWLAPDITYCDDPYEVAKGADALLLVTEWKEFADLDMRRLKLLMRSPLLLDGRQLYDPEALIASGFLYWSMGQPAERVTDLSVIEGGDEAAAGRSA